MDARLALKIAIWTLVNLAGSVVYLWLTSPAWPYLRQGPNSETHAIYWSFICLPVLMVFLLANLIVLIRLRRISRAWSGAGYALLILLWLAVLKIDRSNGLVGSIGDPIDLFPILRGGLH